MAEAASGGAAGIDQGIVGPGLAGVARSVETAFRIGRGGDGDQPLRCGGYGCHHGIGGAERDARASETAEGERSVGVANQAPGVAGVGGAEDAETE